jgi:anti-sigma-K factor RskA
MNDYRCSEVDDLLTGYAADALDEDERCGVAGHLAECRDHDGELSAIRADFERVAFAVSTVEPPAALRTKLLDAFDREVAGNAAAAQAVTPLRRREERRESPKSRFWSTAGLGYALAAVLLVVAAGLSIWGLSRGSDDDGVVLATTNEGEHSMQITYVKDEQLAVLDVDLSAPPEGHTYQAWQIVDGAPVSVGVLNTHSGQVAFSADLDSASAVALSVEPLGGSAAPTTTPILVTELPDS